MNSLVTGATAVGSEQALAPVKFSSPLTSTQKFKEAITEAMEEMYFMCEVRR